MWTILADLKYYSIQLANFLVGKVFLALLGTAFAPHMELLTVLGFLVVLDLMFGMGIAWQRSRFSSAGLRRGCLKIIVYVSLLVAVALTEQAITGTTILTRASLGIMVLTEVTSLLEHALDLGITFPGAILLRRWVRDRAETYGIVYESIPASNCQPVRDLDFIIVTVVPSIKQPWLKPALEVYVNEWRKFILGLKLHDVEGSSDLVWMRLYTLCDNTVKVIRQRMMKQGLDAAFIDTFLSQWTHSIYVTLGQRIRFAVTDDRIISGDKIDVIRDVVSLHCMRLAHAVQKRDNQASAETIPVVNPLPADVKPIRDNSDTDIELKIMCEPVADGGSTTFEPTDDVKRSISDRRALGTTTERILNQYKTPKPE